MELHAGSHAPHPGRSHEKPHAPADFGKPRRNWDPRTPDQQRVVRKRRLETRIRTPRVPFWLRWLVPVLLVLTWLAVAGIGGPTFGRLSEVSSNDQASFLPGRGGGYPAQELAGQVQGLKRNPGRHRGSKTTRLYGGSTGRGRGAQRQAGGFGGRQCRDRPDPVRRMAKPSNSWCRSTPPAR